MALKILPAVGQIVICDFPKEFKSPEMIKRRPVVCVSPKDRNRPGLVTLIPLSTTEPIIKRAYNVEIKLDAPISPAFPFLTCWAKCNMIYTFGYQRLSLPMIGKNRNTGKREYNSIILPPGIMCEIFTGILSASGIIGSVKFENDSYQVFDFQNIL